MHGCRCVYLWDRKMFMHVPMYIACMCLLSFFNSNNMQMRMFLMYRCIYFCLYTCVYACVGACAYTCVRVGMRRCTRGCMHLCACMNIHVKVLFAYTGCV